ncbi:MAG: anti-sigma factor [Pseudomonadota bacterium]
MTERPFKPEDENSLLAAEFALGLLEGSAREDFARRVAADPALAAEVRYWDEHFAGLADDLMAVAPPARVQAQLERRLFAAPERASIWNSLSLWRGVAIAALIVLAVIAGWSLRTIPSGSNETLVAQVAGAGSPLNLVALYNDATGELRLNRTAGSPSAGRSFELWVIVGNQPPVSLGVLPADTLTRLVVPEDLRNKLKDSVLAVSDEPAGGSPTGAPTGAVVGSGRLTAV